MRDVKGNKKCFYKYISSRRMTTESVGSLMNGTGAVVTQDVEKAEVLKAFFTSDSTSKDLQEF